jgi:predicted CoA-substrate-specific enzyme activase
MFFLGVDIGSSATKLIAIDENSNIAGRSVVQLGTGTSGVERAVAGFYESSGIRRDEIGRVTVTGYGRSQFTDADSQISEISCHARGMVFLKPSVRTIIDIGGQDIKVIKVNEKGTIQHFTMNDKCAAGTGRFLDVMSKVLDVPISEMGSLDKQADTVLAISNTCTVFAESEVISKLSSGNSIPNIVAGIHQSVARRVAGLAFRNGMETDIALSGGVALNSGMIRALEKELNHDIVIPDDPQLTGALGAALFAAENAAQTTQKEE